MDAADPEWSSPTVSLVIATFGPAHHLTRCLDSLVEQNDSNFEVIVVDQNDDDRVRSMLDDYGDRLRIMHKRSPVGLSRARNYGIASATGDIVGFPDDDCWFPNNMVKRLRQCFGIGNDLQGLTGRCVSADGGTAIGVSAGRPGWITRTNIWQRGVSTTMYLRREVFAAVGNFDETLGLGSATPFQSGEETELMLRALAAGYQLFFEPTFIVMHPSSPPSWEPGALRRARSYGVGMGRVMRLHDYSRTIVAYHIARPILGSVIAAASGRISLARLRFARAAGRIEGWHRWD